MKRIINFRLVAGLFCLGAVWSCAQNNVDNDETLPQLNTEGISFKATATERVADFSTKGTLIYDVEDIAEVGVYSYFPSGLLYLEDIAADHDGFRSTYLWPQYDQGAGDVCESLNFFGYAPHGDYSEIDGITVVTDATDADNLVLEYIVPTYVPDQPDLLIAKPVVGATDAEEYDDIDFIFEMDHALAAICFNVQNNEAFPDPNKRVYSIEIKEVIGEGKVKRSANIDDNLMWYDTVRYNDFKLYCDISIRPSSTSQRVTSDENYLMMIPQTFTEDVELIVTLCHPLGGCMEDIHTIIPKGTQWQGGYIYEYTLLDDSFIEYEGRADGLANCYMLHPLTNGDRTYYIPIDERINEFWYEYAINDNDEENEWFYLSDGVGVDTDVIWHDCTGGIDGLDISIIDWEQDDYMYNDLFSTNTSKVTPNQSATEPVINYITPNAQVAMKVVLPSSFGSNQGNVSVAVWRDLNGDGKRNTDTEMDDKGKVIAVNETLWSWHLWITDYTPDVEPVASTANNYTYIVSYDQSGEQSGRVHEYQDDTTYLYNDTQAIWGTGGHYGTTNGGKYIMDRHIGANGRYNSTAYPYMGGISYGKGFVVYQFGRKDPFPGNAAIYPSGYAYTAVSTTTNGKASFNDVVHNPTSFYGGSGNWCDESIDYAYSLKVLWNDTKVPNPHTPTTDHSDNNLTDYWHKYTTDAWSYFVYTGFNDTWDDITKHVEATGSLEKSIFDPSPLGWRLPVAGVWSDFAVSVGGDESRFAANDETYTYVGVTGGDYIDKGNGVYEYVDDDSGSYNRQAYSRMYNIDGGPYDFYPISGYIEHTKSDVSDAGTYGFCRTAAPSIQNVDYDFYSNNSVQESGNYSLHITDFAYILCMSPGGSTNNYSYLRSHGMPARAIQE